MLQIAVRRKRITAAQRDGSLRLLGRLPIETDRDGEASAWSGTLRLAIEHGLTLYDFAYLELALRRRLPLASFDQQLVTAARKAGLATL